MSGYERSDSQDHPEPSNAQDDGGRVWPSDFTEEEKRFAAELRELFPIEREILPPLYVQTLLEDEPHAPLSRGYTRRLTSRVMQRLNLPSRSLTPRRSRLGLPEGMTLSALSEPLRRAGTPVITALALVMTLVIGSVYLATPSFAEGLRLLLGQSGAQQLDSYPTNVVGPVKSESARSQGTAPSAPMPLFWLGPVNNGYSYIGMSLLDQQDWSNGPVLDIQYALTQPATQALAAKDQTASATDSKDSKNGQATSAPVGGSGLLDIREFQISSAYKAVLLAVQNGSATMTTVNGQQAVYVDGMWIVSQGGRKSWQSGTRSMLIFERDGVVFWITGDQRDGLTSYPLTQIAAALTQTTLGALRPNRLSARFTNIDTDASLRAPLGANTDVLDVIAASAGENTPTSKFVTLNLPLPTLMN